MCVCVRACISDLGDMLTSRIQGLRFSSSMMSKPNSSWQLYGDSTFIFSKLRTYGSDLMNKDYIWRLYQTPDWTLAVLCSVTDFPGNLRNDGFNHNIFDLLPDQSGVNSPWTEILPQGFQSPVTMEHTKTSNFMEVGKVSEKLNGRNYFIIQQKNPQNITTACPKQSSTICLTPWLLPFVSLAGFIITVGLVFRVLLVDAVVGQVHELVTQGLHGRRIPEARQKRSHIQSIVNLSNICHCGAEWKLTCS